MKWLDNLIEEAVQRKLESFSISLNEFQSKIGNIDSCIDTINQELISFKKTMVSLREEMELNHKILGLKINENERMVREDMEICFGRIIKQVDRKLELLGDKKGIVTDLLKRIAELEGDNVTS